MNGPGIRVGIDVGGTFTDFVLLDPATRAMHLHKESSTPDDPARAVASGFAAVTREASVDPAKVELVAHGTTIGLNSIIQRSGATAALIVSAGAKDVLELARGKMRDPLNFFDSKEVPLVPRSHVIETPFRLDARGRVLVKASQADIEAVVERLHALGARSAAVSITNGYLAPELEQAFSARIARKARDVAITSAAQTWPEIREYERAMVALMNAYISPLMLRYFSLVESGLAAHGFRGKLCITTSNGGTVSVATARQRPIDTVLSGPAAGVVATARFAEASAQRSAITVDMGGTSSDMSVITDADVEYSTRAQVGDFPLFMPVVSVSAIGSGGGSLLWVDDFGVLKVGPESAGAQPGPVCYGRGGTHATITDCYLVCGFLSPEQKLGGQVALSYDKARAALAMVAARLGFEGADAPERAAWSALAVATSKMGTELQKGLAVRGIDPHGYALVPFGGAGPTQAAMLADESRLDRVVIPKSPGTFCALGAVQSDLKRDFSRTIRRVIDGGDSASKVLRDAIDVLRAEGDEWLAEEADLVRGRAARLVADMRYQGQSYEIPVDLAALPGAADDASLTELFHREHERVYRFHDDASRVEVTSVRLTAIGRLEHLDLASLVDPPRPQARRRKRRVYIDRGWREAEVIDRAELVSGVDIAGPAIVEQTDTTTVVLPNWHATADPLGNLVLARKEQR